MGELVVLVVLICFVFGQISEMGNQLKMILLGVAMIFMAFATIVALILSLANHQTLDQLYSAQVQTIKFNQMMQMSVFVLLDIIIINMCQ